MRALPCPSPAVKWTRPSSRRTSESSAGGILPQQCGRRGGELRGGERFGRYAVAHYGGVERICAGAVHQIAVGASRSARVAAGRCRGWCGVGFIVLASGCKHQRNRTHQQQKLFHGIRFLRGFDGVKKRRTEPWRALISSVRRSFGSCGSCGSCLLSLGSLFGSRPALSRLSCSLFSLSGFDDEIINTPTFANILI